MTPLQIESQERLIYLLLNHGACRQPSWELNSAPDHPRTQNAAELIERDFIEGEITCNSELEPISTRLHKLMPAGVSLLKKLDRKFSRMCAQ